MTLAVPDKGLHVLGRPVGLFAIIVYKLLWGVTELGFGMLAIFSAVLIRGELAEDPQDIFVNLLLNVTHMTPGTTAHFGVLFLVLGLTKIGIAVGLWFRSWRMRKYLLVFLGIVTVATVVDIALAWGWIKAFALIADVLVLCYLWKRLPRHLHHGDVH